MLSAGERIKPMTISYRFIMRLRHAGTLGDGDIMSI